MVFDSFWPFWPYSSHQLRRYYFEKFKVKQDQNAPGFWGFRLPAPSAILGGRLGGLSAAYPKGLCGRFVLGLGLLLPGQGFLYYVDVLNQLASIEPDKGLPFLDLVLSISLCARDPVYNLGGFNTQYHSKDCLFCIDLL